MTRITREQFVADLKREDSDVAIDVNHLTPATQEKLKNAGVTKGDLAEIAGDDGKINKDQEYIALYNVVDGFEKNNSSSEYFDTTDAKNALTTSGEAYEALKSQIDFNIAKSILRGPQPSKANPNPITEGPQVSLFDDPKGGKGKKEHHKPELRPLEVSVNEAYKWRAATPKERSQAINRELKERGYSFDDKSFQKAIKKGDVIALKLFIKGDFPGVQKTFLSKVEKGDTKTVQAFLDAGMDPNIRDKQGRTPLMLAGNPETVNALIAKDADVTAKNEKEGGKTVLMYQAVKPDNPISTVLLEKVKAANAIDAPDNYGKTALMYAAAVNDPYVIGVLHSYGAKLEAVDFGGMTALTNAVANDHIEATKKLMELGASPNGDFAEGRDVPLNIAIKHGYWDMVDALLDNPNIDPHLPDYDGKTSFDYARERRDEVLLNQLNKKHDEIMEVQEALMEIAAKKRAQANTTSAPNNSDPDP